MSLAQRIGTAAALLARGRWGLFRQQLQHHRRTARLQRAGDRPFIHRIAGRRYVCFPDLPDSATQYLQGGDDRWELDLVCRWLEPGDAFVDAGANIGLYTHAVAGHFCGNVDVLALEASPHLVQRLVAGAQLLGERRVQAVQVAVGGSSGEVTFHLARPGRTTVSQSMQIPAADAADYEPHLLPMRTLGELIGTHLPGKTVALVKVDVEGAEPLAVRGAPPSLLTADGALWFVEINLPVLARMGFGPGDVLQQFRPEAFERWILPKYPLPGRPPARPRTYDPAERFGDAQFFNLVAVPRGPGAERRRARIHRLFP